MSDFVARFEQFKGWDAVEIVIIALLFFLVWRVFHRIRASRILGEFVVLLAALSLVAKLLDFNALTWVLRSVSAFGVIILIVVFQPELRRAIVELDGLNIFSLKKERGDLAAELAEICRQLSAKRFGALFAVQRGMDLADYLETGVRVDAELSAELCLTLFHPKTVLHDGGVIVKDGRLEGAACVFPVSQRELMDRSIGLRHRAALGLAELTDSVVLVVSEETGSLSLAYDGELERNLEPEEFVSRLRVILDSEMETDAEEPTPAPRKT